MTTSKKLQKRILAADSAIEELCASVGPLRYPVHHKMVVQAYDTSTHEPLGGAPAVGAVCTQLINDNALLSANFLIKPDDKKFFVRKNGVAFVLFLVISVNSSNLRQTFVSGLGDWNANVVNVNNHIDRTVWPVTLRFIDKNLVGFEFKPDWQIHPKMRADLLHPMYQKYGSRALALTVRIGNQRKRARKAHETNDNSSESHSDEPSALNSDEDDEQAAPTEEPKAETNSGIGSTY